MPPLQRAVASPRRITLLGAVMAVFLLGRLVYQLMQTEYSSSPADEILVAGFALFAPAGILRLSRTPEGLKYVLYTAAYFGIVIASSLMHGYSFERGKWPFYLGLILDAKFIVLFFGVYSFALSSAQKGRSADVIHLMILALIAVALINSVQVIRDVLGNGIGYDGDALSMRGPFIRPNGFLHHPVASAQVTLFGFLGALGLIARRARPGFVLAAVYLFLILVAHVSTKEIIVGLLFVMLFVLLFVRNDVFTKILAALVALATVGSVFASPVGSQIGERISYYAGDEGADSVRRALYSGAFEIATELMPLGSGTSTFASEGSRSNGYSSLYFTHGVFGLWGATYQNDTYLLDVFWPKIIAESGFIGLLFFVLPIMILVRAALRLVLALRNPEDFVLFAGIIGVLMISIAAPALGEEFCGVLFYVFGALALARYSVGVRLPPRHRQQMRRTVVNPGRTRMESSRPSAMKPGLEGGHGSTTKGYVGYNAARGN